MILKGECQSGKVKSSRKLRTLFCHVISSNTNKNEAVEGSYLLLQLTQ